MNRSAHQRGGTPGSRALAMLRRVRLMEIGAGALGLAGAGLTWSGRWWSWLIVGSSLVTLSPWPGPGAVLRQAAARPEILVEDPECRRRRLRRALAVIVPAQVVLTTGVGYLILGWLGALAFFAVGVMVGALSAWLSLSLEPPRAG